jgi:hypothetical protein
MREIGFDRQPGDRVRCGMVRRVWVGLPGVGRTGGGGTVVRVASGPRERIRGLTGLARGVMRRVAKLRWGHPEEG